MSRSRRASSRLAAMITASIIRFSTIRDCTAHCHITEQSPPWTSEYHSTVDRLAFCSGTRSGCCSEISWLLALGFWLKSLALGGGTAHWGHRILRHGNQVMHRTSLVSGSRLLALDSLALSLSAISLWIYWLLALAFRHSHFRS